MSKAFRAWDVDQGWLLPPSIHDFVPAGHVAHFVRDTVRALDLSAIVAPYEREERGYPPYHPVMMAALLLYAYSRGIYSSRRIARACEERVDFMAVTGCSGRTSAPSAISASGIWQRCPKSSSRCSACAARLGW